MASFNLLLVVALLSSPLVFGAHHLNKGNAELKAAMDRAAVLAYRDGHWHHTLGFEAGVNLPFICGGWQSPALYPQPQRTPNGTLDHVLEHGVLVAAYVKTEIELLKYDGTTFNAINTNELPVTGMFAEWHGYLVAELSEMYDTPISISYELFDTPTDALNAVRIGEAHLAITPFKTDLPSNGIPRTWSFLPGCPDSGLTAGDLYKNSDDSRWETYSAFREASGQRIGAASNCNVYKMLFLDANVDCVSNTSQLEDGWAAGEYDVVTDELPGTVAIPGVPGATTTFSSLYRRDTCDSYAVAPSSGAKLAAWSSLVLVMMGWLLAL